MGLSGLRWEEFPSERNAFMFSWLHEWLQELGEMNMGWPNFALSHIRKMSMRNGIYYANRSKSEWSLYICFNWLDFFVELLVRFSLKGRYLSSLTSLFNNSNCFDSTKHDIKGACDRKGRLPKGTPKISKAIINRDAILGTESILWLRGTQSEHLKLSDSS